MALTISSCNAFHMPPGGRVPKTIVLTLNKELKIKRASKTIVCTPASCLLFPEHTQNYCLYSCTPVLLNS